MTLPTHSRERSALDQIVIELRRLEQGERQRVWARIEEAVEDGALVRSDMLKACTTESVDAGLANLADRSRPL